MFQSRTGATDEQTRGGATHLPRATTPRGDIFLSVSTLRPGHDLANGVHSKEPPPGMTGWFEHHRQLASGSRHPFETHSSRKKTGQPRAAVTQNGHGASGRRRPRLEIGQERPAAWIRTGPYRRSGHIMQADTTGTAATEHVSPSRYSTVVIRGRVTATCTRRVMFENLCSTVLLRLRTAGMHYTCSGYSCE